MSEEKKELCQWCDKPGRIQTFKFKLTNGRITRKRMHKKCAEFVPFSRPTKKCGKLVRK